VESIVLTTGCGIGSGGGRFGFGGLGSIEVNAYRIYEVMYEEQKRLDKNSVPPRWSHACSLEELVNDFSL